MEKQHIEIMDTTLRDGEQTSGVAYTASEKLSMAKMLIEEVGVDRIEVASARISEGEYAAVEKIVQWASEKNYLDRIEILGFVDGGKSLEWISKAGARVVNLLTKGSLKHVTTQLAKTPEAHIADIKDALAQAKSMGISVNVYLEDWSNGMKDSPDYVLYMINELKDAGIRRFMLPDTLGVLNPDLISHYFQMMTEKFPELHFDSHLHNDYDLAVGNSFAAIKAGAKGIHTTVNGLGERTGNTPLASIVAVVNDHMGGYKTNVVEHKLNRLSQMVERFSGIAIPANKPVVGASVFTQTCGVHADGDSKGDLYHNELQPERFGRVREYALGKTSGKASIQKNLEELGIELDLEAMKKVTARVVELGDKKKNITKDDLPYIISDVLGSELVEERVKIVNYYSSHAFGLKPVAALSIDINGKVYEATSSGDGQYDAFMRALRSIYKGLGRSLPMLKDYSIKIPPGGRTDALVENIITWEVSENNTIKTRALEADQNAAAIAATVKMLNIIESSVEQVSKDEVKVKAE